MIARGPNPPFFAQVRRAAAFSTSGAGTLAQLPWDTLALNSTAFSIDGGDVLLDRSGLLLGLACVTLSADASLTGLRIVITYDLGGPAQLVINDLTFPAKTSGETSAAFGFGFLGTEGKKIRTEIASLGVGSRPILTEGFKTKLGLLWIG